MKKKKKIAPKKEKPYPKNLTADELRETMRDIESAVDDMWDEHEELQREFDRRKLKPKY